MGIVVIGDDDDEPQANDSYKSIVALSQDCLSVSSIQDFSNYLMIE